MEVYRELEALQEEIGEVRHQLEFIPSGCNAHGEKTSTISATSSKGLPDRRTSLRKNGRQWKLVGVRRRPPCLRPSGRFTTRSEIALRTFRPFWRDTNPGGATSTPVGWLQGPPPLPPFLRRCATITVRNRRQCVLSNSPRRCLGSARHRCTTSLRLSSTSQFLIVRRTRQLTNHALSTHAQRVTLENGNDSRT